VLEPLGLRREIEREVMRAAEVYHIQLKALSVDEDEDDYDSQWFKRMTEGNNG
jgi:hypothetical protein